MTSLSHPKYSNSFSIIRFITLVIIVAISFLTTSLITGCQASIGNDGGGNTTTEDNDIIIISNIMSDSSLSKAAKCEACIVELEDQSECFCLETVQCSEEDVTQCFDCEQYKEDCSTEELPEEIPEDTGSDLSEGALRHE